MRRETLPISFSIIQTGKAKVTVLSGQGKEAVVAILNEGSFLR